MGICLVRRKADNGTYFQGFLIDTNVDLAPKAASRVAMLTGVPLSFALGLDVGAIYQKVYRSG
jgi:hypothetical protein